MRLYHTVLSHDRAVLLSSYEKGASISGPHDWHQPSHPGQWPRPPAPSPVWGTVEGIYRDPECESISGMRTGNVTWFNLWFHSTTIYRRRNGLKLWKLFTSKELQPISSEQRWAYLHSRKTRTLARQSWGSPWVVSHNSWEEQGYFEVVPPQGRRGRGTACVTIAGKNKATSK